MTETATKPRRKKATTEATANIKPKAPLASVVAELRRNQNNMRRVMKSRIMVENRLSNIVASDFLPPRQQGEQLPKEEWKKAIDKAQKLIKSVDNGTVNRADHDKDILAQIDTTLAALASFLNYEASIANDLKKDAAKLPAPIIAWVNHPDQRGF